MRDAELACDEAAIKAHRGKPKRADTAAPHRAHREKRGAETFSLTPPQDRSKNSIRERITLIWKNRKYAGFHGGQVILVAAPPRDARLRRK
jgi:hypothetical protein